MNFWFTLGYGRGPERFRPASMGFSYIPTGALATHQAKGLEKIGIRKD